MFTEMRLEMVDGHRGGPQDPDRWSGTGDTRSALWLGHGPGAGALLIPGAIKTITKNRSFYGCNMGVSENRLCTPLYPMVLLIIIPMI